MFFLFLSFQISSLKDSEPLITQEIIDNINKNNKSSFKSWFNPKFSNFTIGDVKRFLSPIHIEPKKHGRNLPIGSNTKEYDNLNTMIAGYSNPRASISPLKLSIYDNKYLCTTWAAAVVSAISLSYSIHAKKYFNFSLQFMLDCDIYGDTCYHRSGYRAYLPFYHRMIPQSDRWDQPTDPLRQPPEGIDDICDNNVACFPGFKNCPRTSVMGGFCDSTKVSFEYCKVHKLNYWKWMKSFLWEVGPITSTIVVDQNFFTYSGGVLTKNIEHGNHDLGMLEVTIIGWGQKENPSDSPEDRWWYVIPHLGTDFGEMAEDLFPSEDADFRQAVLGYAENKRTGIMRIARKIDIFGIESNAYGAVPKTFTPLPLRTPKPV